MNPISRIACADLLRMLAAVVGLSVVSLSVDAAGPAPGAEPEIVSREDVVYGRVHGAGLLADIAYLRADGPLTAIISVHGGR